MNRRSFCASALVATMPAVLAPSQTAKKRAKARELVKRYHAAVDHASAECELKRLACPEGTNYEIERAWDERTDAAYNAIWPIQRALMDFIYPSRESSREDESLYNSGGVFRQTPGIIVGNVFYTLFLSPDTSYDELVIMPMNDVRNYDV